MAAERGFVAPPVSSLRKIMKPVISTDIMGNRNVEVRAVAARAEPALYFTHLINPDLCDAVRAAEMEEEKIKAVQEKKAARLKQFQEDVRRRVRHMNKTKRKQQLENDYQSMEKQLNQVRRSLRASDCLTERKDHVVSRHAPAVSVQSSVVPPRSDMMGGDQEEDRQKVFEKHNEQVRAFTSEARQKLSHRKVESDVHEMDHLPLGKWYTFKSSSKPMKMRGEPLSEEEERNEEENGYDSNDDDDDEDVKGILRRKGWESTEAVDPLRPSQTRDHVRYFSLPARSPPSEECEEAEQGERRSDKEDEEREEEEEEEADDRAAHQAKLQRVKFNLRNLEPRRPDSESKTTTRKKGPHAASRRRPATAPDLQAGAREYAERRCQEQQKLTYRRLYSDLERQAVRDHQRRKKQRSQIQKIKKEKEDLRRLEEARARQLVEPRDPVTGETSVECDLRQQMERSHLKEVLQEREEQRQKQREMIRYLDALRSNLREKLSKQGLELPALCCCGDTLFDTHPDTCANNCFYYKNHRAYARALQSLLTSSDIM